MVRYSKRQIIISNVCILFLLISTTIRNTLLGFPRRACYNFSSQHLYSSKCMKVSFKAPQSVTNQDYTSPWTYWLPSWYCRWCSRHKPSTIFLKANFTHDMSQLKRQCSDKSSSLFLIFALLFVNTQRDCKCIFRISVQLKMVSNEPFCLFD